MPRNSNEQLTTKLRSASVPGCPIEIGILQLVENAGRLADPFRRVVFHDRDFELPKGQRRPRGAVPLVRAMRDEDWAGDAEPWREPAPRPAPVARPPVRLPRPRAPRRTRRAAATRASPSGDSEPDPPSSLARGDAVQQPNRIGSRHAHEGRSLHAVAPWPR